MSISLRVFITVTDVLFILYWTIAGLAELGILTIPRELMYADYDNPLVVAWNWSFFPLDLAFSFVGLAAVRAYSKGNKIWQPLAIISLILTITAGGMAVSYWSILGEFDPAWFIPNLLLVVWPLFFLPQLIKGTSKVKPGTDKVMGSQKEEH